MTFMNTVRATTLMFVFGFLALNLSPAQADDGWRIVGQRVLLEDQKRGQINLRNKGEIGRLKIQVKNEPVEISRIVFHFGGNEKQVFPIDRELDAGDWSRPVKIKSGPRKIERVVIWYSDAPSADGKSTVIFWAKK